MRRLVAALVVVGLAFTLVGCGGGGGDSAETPDGSTTPTAAPAAPAAPEAADRSPAYEGEPVPFPSITSTETPASIQEKLDAGRPMVIFFFDSVQNESKAQRAEIDAALKEYRGLIDLVTFDIKFVAGKASPESSQTSALVAGDLGVTSTPYLILVDGNGYITFRLKGYMDAEILGREVLRATD